MGSDDTLWLFVRMLLTLIPVLGLAYLVIRFGLGKRFSAGTTRRLRMVESLPLGGKGALVLVEMGGRYYFLAFQEGAVELLKELEELPAPLGQTELPPRVGQAGWGKRTFPDGFPAPGGIPAWWSGKNFPLAKVWKHGPR